MRCIVLTYKALYRTWRPQNFKDIVGQQHITKTLQNALAHGRVAHAYLFCGPRGTGKTTTAKVLAKAMNCTGGEITEPCNQCDNCRGVNEGSSVDVIEIDAASNRGIDEIRDLREKVKFTPAAGRHKVYIIDEVHMLTDQAFNALLKTLEEPPSHVTFVLATTEAHKVPVTILSRCQRFDFRRIKQEEIIERLREVTAGTGIGVEEEALQLIAKAAEGGLRDALSLLDQAAAFSEDIVKATDIHSILGTVQQDILVRMTNYLAGGQTGEALELLGEISDRGKDLRLFAREMTNFLRSTLIENIETRNGINDNESLYNLLQILVQAEQEMKWSSQPTLILEMAIIKGSRPELNASPESLARRVAELERRIELGIVLDRNNSEYIPSEPKMKKLNTNQEAPSIEENPVTVQPAPRTTAADKAPERQVGKGSVEKITKAWDILLKGIKEGRKMQLWTILNKGQPPMEVVDNLVTFYFEEEFEFRAVDKPESRKYLEWLLGKHFGEQWEVRCIQGKKTSKAKKPEDDPIYLKP
ncbi:hypothetical protein N752_15635 [Desulforamulus aquiferis]|nr:hypothetical protein N752_15635 [Desulforamulus aquiferis]